MHPSYFKNPTPHSGNDLALCLINVPKNDSILKCFSFANPAAGSFANRKVSVVGFPSECEGEKWGMIGNIAINNQEQVDSPQQDEILVYDEIDTTNGQSGSPVIEAQSGHIIGVHTGGSQVFHENFATCITLEKLKWITGKLSGSWGIVKENDNFYLCEC